MAGNVAANLAQVEAYRRQGAYEQAAQLLGTFSAAQLAEPSVLVETLKLELLRERPEEAYSAYLLLQMREDFEAWRDWPSQIRLQQALNLETLPTEEIPRSEIPSKWVAEFLETGVERLLSGEVIAIRPRCHTGVLNYEVTIRCASCEDRFAETLYFNFLFHRRRLCPACFAWLTTSSYNLRRYFEDSLAEPPEGLGQEDQRFLELMQAMSQSRGTDTIPRLVQYLNQDYLYHLSHNLFASESRARRNETR